VLQSAKPPCVSCQSLFYTELKIDLVSFNRVVLSDLKLSDGLLLPKGQFISFPAGPMVRDPKYHQNPETLDGNRFYKTESEVNEGTAQHEIAGIEHDNIHWGNGRFAYPRRWYASAVMKLIIGLILLDYDVQCPDGQTESLLDAYLDTMIQTNDKQIIWIRKQK
jgi:cytochrome P450